MKFFIGLGLIASAIVLGIWWWRKNYVPSPLDTHFADQTARAQVGDIAQTCAWSAQPMATTVGSGWGTTMRINPTNTTSPNNSPDTLQLYTRFAQPGGF